MLKLNIQFKLFPLLAIWVLIFPKQANGQPLSMKFETITSKDGLPSSAILSAGKDRNGFMWFGSRSLPIRYDGSNFKSIHLSPGAHFVTGVTKGEGNQIWFACNDLGVSKIDLTSYKITSIPGTNQTDETANFYIDKFGNGWYSDRIGVNKIDLKTGKQRQYRFKETTFVVAKGNFVENRDGQLWVIGRDNGLFFYDRKLDSMICMLGADSPDPSRNEVVEMNDAAIDQAGNIWICTYRQGLLRYNVPTNQYETYGTGKTNNALTSIAEGIDDLGRQIFWVGDDEGLGIFRPDEKQFYFFKDIFPVPYEVNDIFIDEMEGIVWACTSQGIIKYQPKSNLIKSVTIPNNLADPSAVVTSVFQTKTNASELYFGLSNTGIIKWNRKNNSFELIKLPGTTSAEIRWITEDADGYLWIGTNRWDYTRPGIFVYDPDRKRFLETKASRLANTYYSVPFFMYGCFDGKDNLWIGNSDEGIHVIDKKRGIETTPWTKEVQRTMLRGNNLINDILIDKLNRVWVAAIGGLYLIDKENGKFTKVQSKRDDYQIIACNSLLEDKRGQIWVANWGNVLHLSREKEIKAILSAREGLFDRENNGLLEDINGDIWIGNFEGLYRYSPKNSNLIRFTENDGLTNNNTTDRIFKSVDGREILVGQKNSINILPVEKLSFLGKAAPPLAISSFKIHDKDQLIDFSKPIKLERSDNAFSVDFIALNYRKHHDNQYAYFLEGFDKKWNYSGTKHVAYYTNLNPGDYILNIKAGDVFGNWSKEILKLQITVKPAYYETWWFRTLILLTIFGFLYSFYRYRINQILKLQQVRNRISSDLHDELGSSLSGISIMGALARNKLTEQHSSTPFVEKIVEEVQQISTSLDDIVWNISPRNDNLESLIARMTRYAAELFEAKQIDYDIDMPEDLYKVKLSMEQRRNLYLIFKEAVNNLVKYSNCSKASIKINNRHKELVFTIEDDGVGFDTKQKRDRNGLKNMAARSESLKGKLEIKSEPSKGTCITLKFPLTR